MKRLAALLILSHSLFSAETMKEVRFDVLIVRLPEAGAVALSGQLRDPLKIVAAQEKLILELGKEVELVDWPTITTPSGQQAVVENIDEIHFPSEFEAPSILLDVPEDPTDVSAPTAPDLVDGTVKPADAKPAESKAEKKKHTVRVEGDLKLVGGVPTTFEVKNAGVTFQVEPVLEPDGKHLRFNFALQHVMFLGSQKSVMEVSPTHKISVEQPLFQTVKSTASMSAASGQPVMLSFHKLREPKDKVEIAICTATIVDTGIPVVQPADASKGEGAKWDEPSVVHSVSEAIREDQRKPRKKDISGAWSTGSNLVGISFQLDQKGTSVTGRGVYWGCMGSYTTTAIEGSYEKGVLSLKFRDFDGSGFSARYKILEKRGRLQGKDEGDLGWASIEPSLR